MAKSIRKSMFATDVGEALVIPGYEPYEIPKNWCWVYLGAINQFVGHSINPLLEAQNIYELYSVPSSENNYPEIVAGSEIGSSKQSVEKDDVLLCKINPRINRVWMVSKYTVNTLIASSEWIVVRNSMICSKYLMWCMRSPYFREYMLSNVSGVGGSLMRAKPEHVKKYPIALAPLAEQHRIVEKIESLFSKLDDAKEKAQEVLDNFENRKASILHKAFTGELTAKWRKKNGVDFGSWKYAKMKSLLDSIKYGTSEKSDYSFGGIPVFRIPNIGDMTLNLDDLKRVRSLEYPENDCLSENDILVIRSNGSRDLVGKCALVPKINFKCTYASFLIRLKMKENILPAYTVWFLSSEDARRQLFEKAKSSSGIHNINSKEIGDIDVVVPCLSEQQEIVNSLSKLIDGEKKIKKNAELVISQIDEMKKSILARAFRGELGTNNSSDKNAKELLKEILSGETNAN